MHGTKSDLLHTAIALMQVAVTAKEKETNFGVADSDITLTTEVIGP